MLRVNRRLRDLGIELPRLELRDGKAPLVAAGALVFVGAGRAERVGERRYVGKLGRELDVAEGREAARLCALDILARLLIAVGGDLDLVVRCVRLAGYVNCTPEFRSQAEVIDAASELLLQLFGGAAHHARMVVGVNALPGDAAVELEATFEVRPRLALPGVRGLA